MRERKVAPSIWRSMVQSVTLYILLPPLSRSDCPLFFVEEKDRLRD